MTERCSENLDCPCQLQCSRHGNCLECLDFHRKTNTMLACMAEIAKGKEAASAEPSRPMNLADRPELTQYAACAG